MERMRIGLEWFTNPDHLPFFIGQEHGWFRDAGLDVVLVEPSAHLDAAAAIEAGSLEAAITEPLHLVEDRARGRSPVGFCRFLHTNGGVMYLESSGITRPRDMAGKRIQYPGAPGPGGPAIVATMIEADGGNVNVDAFERVNRGFSHTDALIEGDADVAVLAFYNFEVIEARHRGHAASFFALSDWGVPDFCQLVLFTSEEQLRARSQSYRRITRVLRRAQDFIHQHPEQARALYYARTGTSAADVLTRTIVEATLPCFTFDHDLGATYFKSLADWMLGRGLASRRVLYEEVWTSELSY